MPPKKKPTEPVVVVPDALARQTTMCDTGKMLRGTSFVGEYMPGGVKTKALAREPTMLKGGGTLLPPNPDDTKRYTVVLDLDETLVFARNEKLFARAHTHALLKTLNEFCEVVVWTAGSRDYAKAVVKEINFDDIIKHLIYRHKSWFSAADYTKDLRMLGRDMDRVLIVENTPQCVNLNPQNGIIVADYEGGEMKDTTLSKLGAMVKELVESGETVPRYLAATTHARKQTVGTRANKLEIYYLAEAEVVKKKVVKRNRDLPPPVVVEVVAAPVEEKKPKRTRKTKA